MSLQAVLLASSQDDEGQLVFADGRLVAVLVRLSALHEDQAGWWFLETGFGVLANSQHPCFPALDGALAWIKTRLADSSARSHP